MISVQLNQAKSLFNLKAKYYRKLIIYQSVTMFQHSISWFFSTNDPLHICNFQYSCQYSETCHERQLSLATCCLLWQFYLFVLPVLGAYLLDMIFQKIRVPFKTGSTVTFLPTILLVFFSICQESDKEKDGHIKAHYQYVLCRLVLKYKKP